MAKTAAQKTKTAALSRAYDEVPYSSYPFAQTSPDLLQGIGSLFGLKAPSPSKARILEIGCASGNNIISIAARYPESTCIGIDYAIRQIELGQQQLSALGLKNIELKHLSVMDIDKSFGQFDYIICHGVLSWVPPEVQDKILEVCGNNLSKDGIAYISYNTLPGWNSVRSAREMMMYHTTMFNTPAEKAAGARQILKFIGDSARTNNNTPLAQVIDRELEILNNQPDYYLLHEHLEENNYQFYFHQFMAMATKNNLQYLAETSLEKMFSGNFPTEIAQVLATSNDIVRTEQYMDYIYDRRFRSTLLCHADRILHRNLNADEIIDGYLLNRFTFPAEFDTIDMANPGTWHFPTAAGLTLTTSDPVALSLLKQLKASGGETINIRKLIKLTTESLKKNKHPAVKRPEQELQSSFCQMLMRYLFTGGIYYYLEPLPYTTQVSAKPATSGLARAQAQTQNWISSQRQEHITISTFDNKLIPLLDGTSTVASLPKKLLPYFETGELVMNDLNQPITDMKTIESRLPEFITSSLERYAALALLVK